jgi:hypothetical protein
MTSAIENQIGPYMHGAGAIFHRVVNGAEYIVGIASAYNAFGLIGPENNGIFVLDETNKRVLTDQIMKAETGYYGPTQAQWEEYMRAMELPAKAFIKWIETSPRFRGN